MPHSPKTRHWISIPRSAITIDLTKSPKASGNTVRFGKLTQSSEGDYTWLDQQAVFFKQNTEIQSRLEAAFASIHRLLLGEQAPIVLLVESEAKKVIGSCSFAIPGFKPFREALQNRGESSPFQTRQDQNTGRGSLFTNPGYTIRSGYFSGLANILCDAYLTENDDLHKDNIGWTDEQWVLIDNDMNLYPITTEYKGARLLQTPALNFPITARDLLSFPVLQDANPYHWPTFRRLNITDKSYRTADVTTFRELSNNPDFIEEKWRALLQQALTPSIAIKHSLDTFLDTQQNPALIARLHAHLDARLSMLRHTLLGIGEFRAYLNNKTEDELGAIINTVVANCALEGIETREEVDDILKALFKTSNTIENPEDNHTATLLPEDFIETIESNEYQLRLFHIQSELGNKRANQEKEKFIHAIDHAKAHLIAMNTEESRAALNKQTIKKTTLESLYTLSIVLAEKNKILRNSNISKLIAELNKMVSELEDRIKASRQTQDQIYSSAIGICARNIDAALKRFADADFLQAHFSEAPSDIPQLLTKALTLLDKVNLEEKEYQLCYFSLELENSLQGKNNPATDALLGEVKREKSWHINTPLSMLNETLLFARECLSHDPKQSSDHLNKDYIDLMHRIRGRESLKKRVSAVLIGTVGVGLLTLAVVGFVTKGAAVPYLLPHLYQQLGWISATESLGTSGAASTGGAVLLYWLGREKRVAARLTNAVNTSLFSKASGVEMAAPNQVDSCANNCA